MLSFEMSDDQYLTLVKALCFAISETRHLVEQELKDNVFSSGFLDLIQQRELLFSLDEQVPGQLAR